MEKTFTEVFTLTQLADFSQSLTYSRSITERYLPAEPPSAPTAQTPKPPSPSPPESAFSFHKPSTASPTRPSKAQRKNQKRKERLAAARGKKEPTNADLVLLTRRAAKALKDIGKLRIKARDTAQQAIDPRFSRAEQENFARLSFKYEKLIQNRKLAYQNRRLEAKLL